MTILRTLHGLYEAAVARGENPTRVRMHLADVTNYLSEIGPSGQSAFDRVRGVLAFNGCEIVGDVGVPLGAPVLDSEPVEVPDDADRAALARVVEREICSAARDVARAIAAGRCRDTARFLASATNAVLRANGGNPRGFAVTLTFERRDVPE